MDLSETRDAAPTVPASFAPASMLPPRALYVHVPFCRHRCGYCNFSVIAGRLDLADRMVDAMLDELRAQSISHPPSSPLDTVFIGGGTPTQLSLDQMQRLVTGIRRLVPLSTDAEWTTEANPEDVDASIAAEYAAMGINRISFGVQSFEDGKLKRLERGHTAGEAVAAIEAVAGSIPNVSVDLIFAAPDETLDQWRSDLRIAGELPIKHLSTYALTIEKGTAFWNRHRLGNLDRPDDDLECEMYELARSMMHDRGFRQYEISSFAADSFRCRHNRGYWRGQPWYAVGPSAARFVAGARRINHASVTNYLKRIEAGDDGVAETEPVSRRDYAAERFAFGIRMIDGIDMAEIASDSSVDVEQVFAEAIQQCLQNNTVVRDGQTLRLTDRGVLYADGVAREFLGCV